ncbi:MAG TPA: hypothetical protein VI479_05895 [Blastocatellia bacterium]
MVNKGFDHLKQQFPPAERRIPAGKFHQPQVGVAPLRSQPSTY